MRVLAVDTTTSLGSLALVAAEGPLAEVRMAAPDRHSRWLLPAVDLVLRGLGLVPSDLDGLAVTTGPGSFTGLRVGLSSVQGLALATGRVCVGLSSLEVLASCAVGSAARVVALVDAFRDEVYSGLFDGRGRPLRGPRVGPIGRVLEEVQGEVAFVGDGSRLHRAEIAAAVPAAVFPPVEPYLAVPLGRLARGRLEAGQGIGPAELRPLYVREADVRKPAT